MADLDKTIDALEQCASGYCEGCVYRKPGGLNLGCWNILIMDAARLLKEQEIQIRTFRKLVEWAMECGFGYDSLGNELWEKYGEKPKEMSCMDGLIYIARCEAEGEE